MDKYIAPAVMSRIFLAIFLACLTTGCSTRNQIKAAYPYLSDERASYLAVRLPWLSSWYRLYSILPGANEANCKHIDKYELDLANRLFSVRNCSEATGDEVASFGSTLNRALDKIEERLDHGIRVTHASYTLVPPKQAHFERDTQIMHADNLAFNIAVRHDSTEPVDSEIHAVRSTAHELYHLALAAMGLTHGGREPAEEARASLFASCVELDVYGELSFEALDPSMQTDPAAFKGQYSAFNSTAGNLEASKLLRGIAGSDLQISSPSELKQFAELCNGLVP